MAPQENDTQEAQTKAVRYLFSVFHYVTQAELASTQYQEALHGKVHGNVASFLKELGKLQAAMSKLLSDTDTSDIMGPFGAEGTNSDRRQGGSHPKS